MLHALYTVGWLLLCNGFILAQPLFTPCNQAFRSDRATIHFFSSPQNEFGEVEVDEFGSIRINPAGWEILLPLMRRGDLLENVQESGYRSEGWYIFDGQRIAYLANDLDDYGNIPREYPVYRDFNQFYWDLQTMNYNNILVPEVTAPQAYWHGGNLPCVYIYAPAILASQGLVVSFQGQDYHISQELKDWVDGHPEPNEGTDVPYVAGGDFDVFMGVVYE